MIYEFFKMCCNGKSDEGMNELKMRLESVKNFINIASSEDNSFSTEDYWNDEQIGNMKEFMNFYKMMIVMVMLRKNLKVIFMKKIQMGLLIKRNCSLFIEFKDIFLKFCYISIKFDIKIYNEIRI